MFFLPKRYFISSPNVASKRIVFTITGTISELRRDYTTVLDAIKNISGEQKKSFKLLLLGRPIREYGLKIIDSCKKLVSKGYDIEFFESYIKPDVMLQKLSTTSIMIAPMNFNYKSGVISEKFTYTKGTGTFNDAMRFGLPTIVPYEYQVAKEFEPCFLKYTNSNHLGNLIIELVQDQQKLFRLKMKTESLMKNYSLNKCQEIFKNIFSKFD